MTKEIVDASAKKSLTISADFCFSNGLPPPPEEGIPGNVAECDHDSGRDFKHWNWWMALWTNTCQWMNNLRMAKRLLWQKSRHMSQ
uniref:Uncharacterized protein n=1 Tax=Ditylenchus dipsaci TaxID=166011 RepID=A0A915ETQ3_9BILA